MISTKGIIRSAAVVCLSAVFASSAIAQPSPERTPSGGTTTSSMDTRGNDRSDRNWNWLGLIGLVGLAGLMRRKEEPRRDHVGPASR